MACRVLIAPDKFKGTLTAGAAAQVIAAGWRRSRPSDLLELFPISDGGDGFGELAGQRLGGKNRFVETVNAAHMPCRTAWWFNARTKTAVIESAASVGLAMLPPGKYHPFDLDTFGLAAVIRSAGKSGTMRCYLGLGGSATNDAGFGLARGVGWKFLDKRGEEVVAWTRAKEAFQAVPPVRKIWPARIIAAVDVTNTLLGKTGATRIFGPQKGLRREQFVEAERNLKHISDLVAGAIGRDFSQTPGTGAAGGLGFGVLAFLGGKLEPGFGLFARLSGLRARILSADLVVTGEGRIDRSSYMGKGAGSVAQLCKHFGLPCIGLAGVHEKVSSGSAFRRVYSMTQLTSEDNARKQPAHWLAALAALAAEQLKPGF